MTARTDTPQDNRKRLLISVCTFKNGTFDVILQDRETGEEVTLSGERQFDEKEFQFLDRVAPACVFTKYIRETPE